MGKKIKQPSLKSPASQKFESHPVGRVSVPLPGILFTSATLVKTTDVSSASNSENKKGLRHCRSSVKSCGNHDSYHTTINEDTKKKSFFSRQLAAKHKRGNSKTAGSKKAEAAAEQHKESQRQTFPGDPPLNISDITVKDNHVQAST